MKPRALWSSALLMMLTGWMVFPLAAGGAEVTVWLPNGMQLRRQVVSLKAARFKNMVPQRWDLSCGAAAMATILSYYYNDPVDEAAVVTHILKHGDQAEIAKKGFSLLDLKRFAESRNYMAAGYKGVAVENLRKLEIPAIILFKVGRYDHFVVLRGIQGDKAYIADPAFGNRAISIESFKEEWNQVVFLVANKKGEVLSQVPVSSTLSAPEMNVRTLQGIGSSGFSFSQTKGEF